jgi:hypothetical protein
LVIAATGAWLVAVVPPPPSGGGGAMETVPSTWDDSVWMIFTGPLTVPTITRMATMT